jgi:hypothetical protein
MYVKRNNKARSRNHRSRGKARSITCFECVCSLTYPACNAHAPYLHLWPARIYNIFPRYLINGTIFRKRVIEHKMCFDFPWNFRLKVFSFKEQFSTSVFMGCTRYSFQILMKLGVSRKNFE